MNFALLGLLLSSAHAAAPSHSRPVADWVTSCAADTAKHCANERTGIGCLVKHSNSLSLACKASVERSKVLFQRIRTTRDRWAATCSADQAKHCSMRFNHTGALIACMKKNRELLSPECYATLMANEDDLADLKRLLPKTTESIIDCAESQTRLCPSANTGVGLDFACLKSVAAKLTPRCRSFITGLTIKPPQPSR